VTRNSDSDNALAVLFDRDGTLIHDVPYNGDPELVEPVSGAGEVLAELRARGIGIGVVTNQSGIGRGLLTHRQVAAVNAKVEQLLGPIGTWQICPHGPLDGCACRKPQPTMVVAACAALGVPVNRATVIGDIEADVQAGLRAGARAVLVPNAATAAEEIGRAPHTARDLREAVALALERR